MGVDILKHKVIIKVGLKISATELTEFFKKNLLVLCERSVARVCVSQQVVFLCWMRWQRLLRANDLPA